MHNSHAKIENQLGAYLDSAVKVLKDIGKPLHYKEITQQAALVDFGDLRRSLFKSVF